MIPCMHHLMRHCVLLMPSVPELVGAKQDPVIQTEAPRLLVRAHTTQDVLLIQIAPSLSTSFVKNRMMGEYCSR